MRFGLRSLVVVCLSSSRNAEVVVRPSSPLAAAGKWLLPAGRPDLMEGRLQEEGVLGKVLRWKREGGERIEVCGNVKGDRCCKSERGYKEMS